MNGLEHLESDYDLAEYLFNSLVDAATGGSADQAHYQYLRKYFLDNPITKTLVPRWLKTNRDPSQFWQFIKNKFGTYAERRDFLRSELELLLSFLESKETFPAQQSISEVLSNFDEDGVHQAWARALERKSSDPEGAITIARTILESVCKHILDENGIEYNSSKTELPELYKKTAKELNLSPSQHTEEIFKQILGGCSAIVSGLGSMRNKLGDAHGQGKAKVKPAKRHAELAVNLAGSMALFLIETNKNRR
jgi:hypothetical protein